MSSKRITLSYTLDDLYIYPFLVSCFAAHRVFKGNVLIEVIQPSESNQNIGMSEEGLHFCEVILDALKIEFNINRIDVSKSSQDIDYLPIWSRFPKTTWLRYYSFYNKLDKGVQNVFYVEPDTMFFSSSEELHSIIEQTRVIAARSTNGHEIFERDYSLYKSNVLGGYFNCGVLIINRKNWCRDFPEEDWWAHVKEACQKEFTVIEQDALNLMLKGNQEWLGPEFNQYPDEFSKERTKLIHFAGGSKPWLYPSKIERLGKSTNAKLAFEEWDKNAVSLETCIESKLLQEKLVQYKHYLKPSFLKRIAQRLPRLSQTVWKLRRETRSKLSILSKQRGFK